MQKPQQYIVVDDKVLRVAYGQFVLVDDYNKLLKAYKKFIRYCQKQGVMDSKGRIVNMCELQEKIDECKKNCKHCEGCEVCDGQDSDQEESA